MGENEQPQQPAQQNLPEVPPAGVDPETFRQYQEFQRFQQFQRFAQGAQQSGPTAPPWTAEGGNLVPAGEQAPPGPGVHEQLAGMRDQLDKITTSQEKIERVTNPPIWRKILRSTPIRWLVGLLVLIILAVWGVPLIVQHYFGSGNSAGTDNAGLPQSKGDSGQLVGSPIDAVVAVYELPAEGFAPSRTCFTFSSGAAAEFAHAFGVGNCVAAINKIKSEITDPNAYAQTSAKPSLNEPAGQVATISSCDLYVSGGPLLGAFTVTKQTNGWEITRYTAATPCPSTAPSTSAGSTATTAPGIPTEPAIPTGSFPGIPTG